jgi:hypothetical protein
MVKLSNSKNKPDCMLSVLSLSYFPEDLIIEITGLTPEQLAALKAAPAGEGN